MWSLREIVWRNQIIAQSKCGKIEQKQIEQQTVVADRESEKKPETKVKSEAA